jgi:hypothetical protein
MGSHLAELPAGTTYKPVPEKRKTYSEDEIGESDGRISKDGRLPDDPAGRNSRRHSQGKKETIQGTTAERPT